MSTSLHWTNSQQNCYAQCRAEFWRSSSWHKVCGPQTQNHVSPSSEARWGLAGRVFLSHITSTFPQPTCDTSLDGLQFASLPAPPYVSRKRGNKEIPCYALQCFPEKPHPCTWDEAEESEGRAFTTHHQQVQKAETSMGVSTNGVLVHARVSYVSRLSHFYLEDPSVRVKPEARKASGSRGIPGGVRTWVSTQILTIGNPHGHTTWRHLLNCQWIKKEREKERERETLRRIARAKRLLATK